MALRGLLTAAAVYTALAGLAFVLAPQAAGAGRLGTAKRRQRAERRPHGFTAP